jgi:protein-S-isoprenylcysteine O-methyltransferase Ste14
MTTAVTMFLGLNYAFVAALPFLFFENRDRRLPLMWWVTAAPFLVLPLFVLLPATGIALPLLAPGGSAAPSLSLFALASSALSILLIVSAVHAHRRRASLWHQERDLPPALVLHGPYARVRHPFYLAFLLMFLAAAMAAPGAGTVSVLIYAFCVLSHTATREERRLCASPFGAEYSAYMARSGRFFPSLRSAT